MKLKRKQNVLIILCTILIAFILFQSNRVLADTNVSYWNEGVKAQTRSGWMDWLPNEARVSQLSLPGTHDSMAWKPNLTGLDITRTQTMGLEDQLISGIRVIDIRVKYEETKFSCYHGPIYLGYDFDHVLKTIENFLRNNPTETVFMRFSQENSSASDEKMKMLFIDYYRKYENMFYKGRERNPKVKDIRGKLVLFSNVWSLNPYGIDYRDLIKQDAYHLNTNWDLYSKWLKVKEHLNLANNRQNKQDIYMNYLSGSGGSFPYFVASGKVSPQTWAGQLSTGLTEPGFHNYYPDFPRGSWFGVFATIYFEGTNKLCSNYIESQKPLYTGIIMADFPGAQLINNIIECNRGIQVIND
ncbi:phosphatidylinositol-specific phospholipase C [Enterococcus faecium]|uniref:1-phosphatidylinositol phosphodiesterase n=1 Tax=Enterococcus faecium TaxID=1352 RepID=A0A9X3XUM6_ENTFC|nr:phosphatidylinositol-specific phospholipase C [Enterococcus faecium]MDC4249089.1 phosphatidylinositol-specific phospholipase C [Enterococcus faecium]